MRLPGRRHRLAALGVVALVGLGGVVAVTRPSRHGEAVEVQASGDSGPPVVGDPRPAFDPSPTSSTVSDQSSSSSSTIADHATVTTKLPKPTTSSAPTTTTTTVSCAPANPVYAFGLARRPDGNGWAAGGNPALQRSTDGGLTWTPACLPAAAVTGPGALYAVVFDADDRHGWAVGGSGGHPVALRTVDGGDHWLAGALPAGIAGNLSDVEFPDGRHGWAVGLLSGTGPANAAGGVILASGDGGATWVSQTVPAEVGRLNRVSFADATHGWAVGAASSGKPVMIGTGDGGVTWSTQALPDGLRELRDVAFVDGQRGWAVGALPIPLPLEAGKDDPGVILTTSDGGATWTQQAATNPSLWSIAVIDAHTVFAGGGKGLWTTHDGGATWDKQDFTLPALDAISFTDSTHGWVTHSMFSIVCRTDDGGRTWVPSALKSGGTPTPCIPA